MYILLIQISILIIANILSENILSIFYTNNYMVDFGISTIINSLIIVIITILGFLTSKEFRNFLKEKILKNNILNN